MANGGRGLMLMDLEPKEEQRGAAAYALGEDHRPGPRRQGPRGSAGDPFPEQRQGARGRKGKVADLGLKPLAVTRVE